MKRRGDHKDKNMLDGSELRLNFGGNIDLMKAPDILLGPLLDENHGNAGLDHKLTT